jgi:hypothetical protein
MSAPVPRTCPTCHHLDRSKVQYWRAGPSRYRMFQRYYQYSNFHSLRVPLRDLKRAAKQSCSFCNVALDLFRWLLGPRRGKGRSTTDCWLEICIPDAPRYPVVLTYSWGSPVPRVYDFQLSIPKPASALPWSAVTVGLHISGDLELKTSLFRASAWLKDCLTKHQDIECCLHPARVMPTRLLFVGDRTSPARLIETRGRVFDYFALSYCWGDTRHSRATKENCPHLLETVSGDFLPQTYLDAIAVTKRLGYQYIWIDSICIVQGEHLISPHESCFEEQALGLAELCLTRCCNLSKTCAAASLSLGAQQCRLENTWGTY